MFVYRFIGRLTGGFQLQDKELSYFGNTRSFSTAGQFASYMIRGWYVFKKKKIK